jgi:hypothetical protein
MNSKFTQNEYYTIIYAMLFLAKGNSILQGLKKDNEFMNVNFAIIDLAIENEIDIDKISNFVSSWKFKEIDIIENSLDIESGFTLKESMEEFLGKLLNDLIT